MLQILVVLQILRNGLKWRQMIVAAICSRENGRSRHDIGNLDESHRLLTSHSNYRISMNSDETGVTVRTSRRLTVSPSFSEGIPLFFRLNLAHPFKRSPFAQLCVFIYTRLYIRALSGRLGLVCWLSIWSLVIRSLGDTFGDLMRDATLRLFFI